MRDTFYIDNPEFIQTDIYREFMMNYPGKGNLKIRAYAASEALPVSGLKITVSTVVDNHKIIFFEGETDASGMIETLSLPTPALNLNNLEVPETITYQVVATMGVFTQEFFIKMYEGICVVQNINFVPGGNNGN